MTSKVSVQPVIYCERVKVKKNPCKARIGTESRNKTSQYKIRQRHFIDTHLETKYQKCVHTYEVNVTVADAF